MESINSQIFKITATTKHTPKTWVDILSYLKIILQNIEYRTIKLFLLS